MPMTPVPSNARKVIENFSYALTDAIGKGFSSIVYRGRNDETNEIVAIKVIDKKGLKTPLHYQLLRSEVEALSQLNSNNIMRLYKVYYTENNTYLITEYCDSGDLGSLLTKQGAQKESQLQRLFQGIIQGYKQMKQKGIVHRDLKPANILLKGQVPKIADFGFATTPQTVATMPNVNVGSPLYMSPQAFKNRYSEKSDIWALGVSLFELLFGQVPWQAGTERELAQRMATVPVNFPGHLSDECRDFIQRCLVVDENRRATVEELERHVWLQRQELQVIKGNGFQGIFRGSHGGQQNHIQFHNIQSNGCVNTTSPLGEAHNKQQMLMQPRESTYGKENTSSIPRQQQGCIQQQPLKSIKRVQESRKESQVNQSMNQEYSSQRDEEWNENKKNDYIIVAQMNFCRYLYRVAALIDKYRFVTTQYLREKLLFLVNKNIMVKMNNLKEVIDGHNALNLDKFQEYIQNPQFSKLSSAINQYNQKYTLQFNTVWLCLQNPEQKQLLVVDKKFDAIFDDNFTEYESFYIILNSILRSAIKEIEYQLEQKITFQDTQQLLPIDIEGGVILLDYLITYFQLASLIQECFEDHYGFAVDSKIEQIADGKPVRLTFGHYIEIRSKIKQLDI
ncbi:unnamed protein product (macronuclear) [Paramecium tetraurelia]|uniref:Protein kinase domain-containing protein n=1 Tax=Paramecium tetraurelia TaxID=5888 RepID=A0BS94_PARTE|nr:uncharacterized protein GSPATT00031642001 [Paramecium tetraurelia]CAK61411.1 unnamed protein product [Paramecium tetraurelia]|eukprot:XP_001428809.1 hypothetical protein (macronuclear) [Paramecium tetraurelia strain d4-2]